MVILLVALQRPHSRAVHAPEVIHVGMVYQESAPIEYICSRVPTMRGASVRRDSVSGRSRRQAARVCLLLAGVAAAAGLVGYVLGTDGAPLRNQTAATKVITRCSMPVLNCTYAAHVMVLDKWQLSGASLQASPASAKPERFMRSWFGGSQGEAHCSRYSSAAGCLQSGSDPEAGLQSVLSVPCHCIPVLTVGAASQGSQWHRQGVPKWSWGMGEASAEEQPKVCTGCRSRILHLSKCTEVQH